MLKPLFSLSLVAIVSVFLPPVSAGQNALVADSLKGLHASEANRDYEPALIAVIEALQRGELALALELVDMQIAGFPKSREAHLLRGDILKAMVAPLRKAGDDKAIESEHLVNFKHQIKNRWRHANEDADKAHRYFPSSLVDLGEHEYVMVADMSSGRLYLYKNADGIPQLVRDYYMSIGAAGSGKQSEGDNKTPIGVYEVNRYIEGKALPDLYGKGAFPVDYPNIYDRSLKRTGYGIWLHGTPSSTYARSPWASEGCFVLSNDDLLDIGKYISAKKRTPVILSDELSWIDAKEFAFQKNAYRKIIDDWKEDWQSLNVRDYLKHYSQDNFNLGAENFNIWADRKRNINLAKTFIQVDLEVESLFLYPGEDDMFVIKYKQRYLSNNYSGEVRKQQYWKRDSQGQWKIIYEG